MGRRASVYLVYNLDPVWVAWKKREAREGKILTFAELARRVGIQPNSLYRLMKERDRQPSPQTVALLAAEVGMSVDDLIVDAPNRSLDGEETAQDALGVREHGRVR